MRSLASQSRSGDSPLAPDQKSAGGTADTEFKIFRIIDLPCFWHFEFPGLSIDRLTGQSLNETNVEARSLSQRERDLASTLVSFGNSHVSRWTTVLTEESCVGTACYEF